jgi:hypothetical protein
VYCTIVSRFFFLLCVFTHHTTKLRKSETNPIQASAAGLTLTDVGAGQRHPDYRRGDGAEGGRVDDEQSVGTHFSAESSLLNDNERRMPNSSPNKQARLAQQQQQLARADGLMERLVAGGDLDQGSNVLLSGGGGGRGRGGADGHTEVNMGIGGGATNNPNGSAQQHGMLQNQNLNDPSQQEVRTAGGPGQQLQLAVNNPTLQAGLAAITGPGGGLGSLDLAGQVGTMMSLVSVGQDGGLPPAQAAEQMINLGMGMGMAMMQQASLAGSLSAPGRQSQEIEKGFMGSSIHTGSQVQSRLDDGPEGVGKTDLRLSVPEKARLDNLKQLEQLKADGHPGNASFHFIAALFCSLPWSSPRPLCVLFRILYRFVLIGHTSFLFLGLG